MAHIVNRWNDLKTSSRTLLIVGILIAVAGVCLMMFPVAAPFLKDKYPLLEIFEMPSRDWRLWVMYGIGIVTAIFLWNLFRRIKQQQITEAVVLTVVVLLIVTSMVQVYYVPKLDQLKSVKVAAEKTKSLVASGGSIAFFYGRSDYGWNFYLNQPKIPVIKTVEQLNRHENRYDVIISMERYLGGLQELINQNRYEVSSIERVGKRRFMILKLTASI